MMRLIDQPAGTGDLYENGEFRGPVHYSLNVYQQYGEGRNEAGVGVQHIEGRITPAGTLDLRVLRSRGAELLMKMSDGRVLHFHLRDDDGHITLNGGLTNKPERTPRSRLADRLLRVAPCERPRRSSTLILDESNRTDHELVRELPPRAPSRLA